MHVYRLLISAGCLWYCFDWLMPDARISRVIYFFCNALEGSGEELYFGSRMSERRQYRRPSVEERWALIRAHEDGEDYYGVAEQPQIRRGTAWSIIVRYVRTEAVATLPSRYKYIGTQVQTLVSG